MQESGTVRSVSFHMRRSKDSVREEQKWRTEHSVRIWWWKGLISVHFLWEHG